jgi:hypothetical protein
MSTKPGNLTWRGYIVVALILCGVAVLPSNSVTVDGAAGDWFKMTPSQREAYLDGWFMGMEGGFTRGCASGFDARYVPGKEDEDIRFAKACASRNPLRGAHPKLSAGQVTLFYRKYPALRGVPVDEVLSDLALGDTVEKVHDRLTANHN